MRSIIDNPFCRVVIFILVAISMIGGVGFFALLLFSLFVYPCIHALNPNGVSRTFNSGDANNTSDLPVVRHDTNDIIVDHSLPTALPPSLNIAVNSENNDPDANTYGDGAVIMYSRPLQTQPMLEGISSQTVITTQDLHEFNSEPNINSAPIPPIMITNYSSPEQLNVIV